MSDNTDNDNAHELMTALAKRLNETVLRRPEWNAVVEVLYDWIPVRKLRHNDTVPVPRLFVNRWGIGVISALVSENNMRIKVSMRSERGLVEHVINMDLNDPRSDPLRVLGTICGCLQDGKTIGSDVNGKTFFVQGTYTHEDYTTVTCQAKT